MEGVDVYLFLSHLWCVYVIPNVMSLTLFSITWANEFHSCLNITLRCFYMAKMFEEESYCVSHQYLSSPSTQEALSQCIAVSNIMANEHHHWLFFNSCLHQQSFNSTNSNLIGKAKQLHSGSGPLLHSHFIERGWHLPLHWHVKSCLVVMSWLIQPWHHCKLVATCCRLHLLCFQVFAYQITGFAFLIVTTN